MNQIQNMNHHQLKIHHLGKDLEEQVIKKQMMMKLEE
jgi:hypothetical protein